MKLSANWLEWRFQIYLAAGWTGLAWHLGWEPWGEHPVLFFIGVLFAQALVDCVLLLVRTINADQQADR